MKSVRRTLAVACALLATAHLAAQDPADWSRPFEPFRIVGNVYWVGTYDLSSYLITSPEGHIVINTGLVDSVRQILGNIEKLGFKPADVRILTATHAHWDHVAGLARLKQATNARVYMSAADAELLESGGRTDFRWGDDPNARFEAVTVDRRLQHGEVIELGGNRLTLHVHAGHTKGASSFTFVVRDADRSYNVGIINMPSINPGVRVSGMPRFPAIGDAYARTFAAQKALAFDIWLSSHASQFRLHDKHKPGTAYNPVRFVDPAGYRAAVESLETAYLKQLAAEQK